MCHRAVLVAIAAAAVGLANVSAPALARGGGGGGGGGHGGFAAGRAFMGFGTHARTFRTPGNSALQRSGRVVIVSHSNPSGRVLSPIRPEVIRVPSSFGSGVLIPPFTTPIVPPIGSVTTVPWFAGLPAVVTPWGYASAFGAGFFGSGFIGGAPTNVYVAEAPANPPGLSEPPQAATGVPQAGPTDATPAEPNSPLAACHPVPSGYYCNWPS